MSYLVATNVLSEAAKRSPEPRVVAWLREHETELYISTVTVGEIRRGIERLPDGKRKTVLRSWLQDLCQTMRGRLLSFNTSTANVWGQLKARWDREGTTIGSLDSQIAATANRNKLVLVTRNEGHFRGTGVKVINPFTAPISAIRSPPQG